MEKEYKVYHYSRWRMVLIMFGPLLPGIVLLDILFGVFGVNDFWQVIMMLGFCMCQLWVFYKISPIIARRTLLVSIKPDGVLIKEQVPMRWLAPKPDIDILFEDMYRYKYDQAKVGVFKVYTKSQGTVRVVRWTEDRGDDFELFYRSFEKMIAAYNKKKSATHQIKRMLHAYEQSAFLITITVALVVLVVGAIWAISLWGVRNPKAILNGLWAVPTLIWTGWNVYHGLKRKWLLRKQDIRSKRQNLS